MYFTICVLLTVLTNKYFFITVHELFVIPREFYFYKTVRALSVYQSKLKIHKSYGYV